MVWARQAQGVEEIKRRKKELNSMRTEFNAYRWKARKEWANRKVTDLQKSRRISRFGCHSSYSARNWPECGEDLFGQRSGILPNQCSDHTLGIPRTRSNERSGKICRPCSRDPDESQIGLAPRRSRNSIYDWSNQRDSAPSTDEITKTLIIL